jgi:hypothetical protein
MRRGRGASAAAVLRRAGFYYWLKSPAALIGPPRKGPAFSGNGGPALRRPRRAAALRHTKEPLQLVGVQPVPANHRTVEEQDWNVQAMAADKLRIGVHVHDMDGGQADPAPEGFQLADHLIAQIAVLPVHHRQSGLGGPNSVADRAARRRQAQWCGPLTGLGLGPCVENEAAMERTVAGGTSPTAVTFLPPITVEYTEDDPIRADSSVTV